MYPSVRPGDVLRIESASVAGIALGDIAVCRRPGYLFGHRTIQKGEDNGRPFIVTRPDRTRAGDDGRTFGEDVLGVVRAIERRGRLLDPGQQRHGLPARFYFAIRAGLIESRLVLRQKLIDTLPLIQQGHVYRSVARHLMSVMGARWIFEVRLPLHTEQAIDLYHPVAADEFDMDRPWLDRPLESWGLVLRTRNERIPAASATFRRWRAGGPPDGWRLDGLHVRRRYQGAGLEKDLRRKAEEITSRSGATIHWSSTL